MLDSAEILLVLANPAELLASEHRAHVAGLVAPSDHDHVARFRAERDRDIALASRATQRLALSLAADGRVAPPAWRFTAGQNDRPQLCAATHRALPLQFSASNTVGLVGCAVAANRAVGLDLERAREDLPEELLERCLSVSERGDLLALPQEERAARFVYLWTVKEAYLKARSLGVAEPLQEIEVRLDDLARPVLHLGPALGDIAARWYLETWRPTSQHFAAVCIERFAVDRDLRVNRRWAASTGDPAFHALAG